MKRSIKTRLVKNFMLVIVITVLILEVVLQMPLDNIIIKT